MGKSWEPQDNESLPLSHSQGHTPRRDPCISSLGLLPGAGQLSDGFISKMLSNFLASLLMGNQSALTKIKIGKERNNLPGVQFMIPSNI